MQVSDHLETVQSKISVVAGASGRHVADIHLIAVSKKQPLIRIQEALDAGHRLFGENRVQEAQEHWGDLRGQYGDLTLHLIGPLQTNKVKDAVALFDVIETIDREKLAKAVAKEIKAQNRSVSCLIQVNTGEEEQKAGVSPQDLPDFYRFCVNECGLDVKGLMCIPPYEEPSALHFALLSKLANGLGLSQLSMGMSGDFEKAIPLGATYVRVGTGVFGERDEA